MATKTPTSVLLEGILRDLPDTTVTPDWLLRQLGERSFGLLLLVLGILGLVPGASILAGLLMMVPAWQMLAGHARPSFPASIGRRRIAAPRLGTLLRRLLPALRRLEMLVRPRLATPERATQRGVGAVVLLLALTLLVPVPLTNLLPSAIIVLIAFAAIEEDGLALFAGMALGLLALVVGGLVAWQMLQAEGWALALLHRLGLAGG